MASGSRTGATTSPACPRARHRRTDQAIGTGDGDDDRLPAGEALRLGRAIVDARHRQAGGGHACAIALGGASSPPGGRSTRPPASSPSAAAPGAVVAITAGFAFDVPVRFDTDALDVTLDLERLGSITSIPLLEIRR